MTPRQWNLALLAVLVGAFAVFGEDLLVRIAQNSL